MAAHAGAKIETDGLASFVFLNGKNTAEDINLSRNHLLSKWYCHESSSNIRYAIIGKGGTLYEEQMDGSISIIAGPTTSDLTSAQFSATAGRYYYGDCPVSFYEEGRHYKISPVALKGTLFWTRVTRYHDVFIYVFAPDADATISVYRDGTGINGTAVQTVNITKQQTGQYITLDSNGQYYFSSTADIIMTRTATIGGGSSIDACIMIPMKQNEYIYARRTHTEKTAINGAVESSGTHYVYDSSNPAGTLDIADGAGGDMEVGIPESYLSNTYVIPDDITNYCIVAPNTNTVLVQYWSGSSWITHNTHSFTGTAASPGATEIGTASGNDPNIAGLSNGQWRFKGTDVFYVLINDDASDEESLLLGYMTDNLSDPDINRSIKSKIFNGIFKKNGRRLPSTAATLDGFSASTDNLIVIPHSNDINLTNNFSMEIWFNGSTFANNSNNNGYPTIYAKGEQNYRFFYDTTTNSFYARFTIGGTQLDNIYSFTPSTNQWYHVVVTKSSTEGVKIYFDSAMVKETAGQTGAVTTNTDNLVLGDWSDSNRVRSFEGQITGFKMYNKVLRANQVKRNYRAFRKRYK